MLNLIITAKEISIVREHRFLSLTVNLRSQELHVNLSFMPKFIVMPYLYNPYEAAYVPGLYSSLG